MYWDVKCNNKHLNGPTKNVGLEISMLKTNIMKISFKTHCAGEVLRSVDEFLDMDSIICIHTIPCPEYVSQELFS